MASKSRRIDGKIPRLCTRSLLGKAFEVSEESDHDKKEQQEMITQPPLAF